MNSRQNCRESRDPIKEDPEIEAVADPKRSPTEQSSSEHAKLREAIKQKHGNLQLLALTAVEILEVK